VVVGAGVISTFAVAPFGTLCLCELAYITRRRAPPASGQKELSLTFKGKAEKKAEPVLHAVEWRPFKLYGKVQLSKNTAR